MGIGMDANIDAFIKGQYPTLSLATNPAEVLGICAVKNRMNYVDYLLDSGMDINMDEGHVLGVTCFHENYEMARHLIQRGANLFKAEEGARKKGLDKTVRNLINLWSQLKNEGLIK
jgi:hypothetical protein